MSLAILRILNNGSIVYNLKHVTMDKKRSLSTKFWDDNWVMELDPTEKLLFLYLLTNSHTNLLGFYELHIRKMAFETGIDSEMIKKILLRFQKDNKIIYQDGWVLIVNFVKNQKYNPSMIANVKKILQSIPDEIKNRQPVNSLLQPVYSLLQIEIEIESKIEKEIESENEGEIPAWEDFLNFALDHKPDINQEALELKYNAWKENNWTTAGNKPHKIINWKTTLLNTLPHIGETAIQKKELTKMDFTTGF